MQQQKEKVDDCIMMEFQFKACFKSPRADFKTVMK